jgi:hypothetical protein
MSKLSDVFESNIGLLQGEISSPILFSLFLNDIEMYLQSNSSGITLDQISIYLLLFADDAVIISDTKEGLQESLNNLEQYCLKWNLSVNIDKTKIIVFRKGGLLGQNCTWTYAGQNIEVVNRFNYLGVVFSSGNSFMHATKTLAGKALRSLNSLFCITRNREVPINIMFNLFDAYVLSVLNYGCEVWGFSPNEILERIHKKFCKWIVNVKLSTNTLALYSEFGRFPLHIGRLKRIIKYWLNLHGQKQNNCILKTIIEKQRFSIEHNSRVVNWSSKVRDILQSSGFNDVWQFPSSVNIKVFIPILDRRLKDIYITEWRMGVESSSALYIYRELKQSFERSTYLTILENTQFRNMIAKIRLSSHKLFIEIGRHRNIPRNERKCIVCNSSDIEDEYHFVLICTFYRDLRARYIPRYYTVNPSMFKFITLLNSNNKRVLSDLALYCIKAFKQRDAVINT